tara:strand:+ start:2756 stop:3568 length:813 start_codon:yes stop_codon:yes gene_type:complete
MLKRNYDGILVCYLFTKFDDKQNLINFIKNYKKNNSGFKHKLLICFKLLNSTQINFYKNFLKGIKYIEYIDISKFNDYDLGSYSRVAQKYPFYTICFLSGNSYPFCKHWLKKMFFHFKKGTIVGTTASNESLFTSLKFKKFYKFFSYFFKFLKYKKRFNKFPNPHIRTTGFLINGIDFLNFIKHKKFKTKEDAWYAESGINGMTNFFKKKRFNIYVVNSDGDKFTENQWKFSETFNFLSQSKSLISDKHTRKYLKLSNKMRIISEKATWG